MTYQLRHPGSAEALFDALKFDPFYATLAAAASSDRRLARAAMLNYLDYSLVEAETYGIASFPADPNHGAAAWGLPLQAALREDIAKRKQAFIQRHMGGNCLPVYQAITANMHAETDQRVPRGSWYLSIVGISPAAQGLGLGRSLIEDVLQQADETGIATYLETFTPRNERFYERLGYSVAAHIHEPVTGARYAVMLREVDGI